jgi:hypothetical protein
MSKPAASPVQCSDVWNQLRDVAYRSTLLFTPRGVNKNLISSRRRCGARTLAAPALLPASPEQLGVSLCAADSQSASCGIEAVRSSKPQRGHWIGGNSSAWMYVSLCSPHRLQCHWTS